MMQELVLNVKNQKRSFSYTCSLIALFLLAICATFSPVRGLSYFNNIWSALLIGWIFFSIVDNPAFFLTPQRFRFLIIFYIIYTVTVGYLSENPAIGNRYFELSQVLIFYLAYEKNKATRHNSDNYWIIGLLVPFLIYTSIVTFVATLTDPWISREIATREPGTEIYLKLGIGSYEFIYFLVITVGVMLFSIYNNYKPVNSKNKLFGTMLIVLFALNIVMTNFSTALFLLLVCIFFRLFIPRLKTKYWLLYVIGGLVAIYLLSNLFILLLDSLTDLLGGSLNASRVDEMKGLLLKNQTGDALDSRNSKWDESINAFLDNPLFGILTKPLNISDGFLVGFGQHSQILDTFALYGAGIGILQVYLYLKVFMQRIKTNRGYISGLTLLIMIVFFVMVTFDNATPSIGFAAFFIFPTAHDWLYGPDKI